MVSFKLAVFLGATTFVTCALAAPVSQGATNAALARRSQTSSDISDVLDPARQGSDSDDFPRSSGSISHGSAHSEVSSDDESPTSTLRRPVAPIRPVPVRLVARPIRPVPVRPRPIQTQAERTRTQVDEAGPSRPRPDSPRPDSPGPSTRNSSRGNHVLETIPERSPIP